VPEGMAKYKLAKGKRKTPPTRGLAPCLILIVSGVVLMSLFFYFMLKSAGN
jgi:hypothetical protein